jgi:multicomponent Na+:H+ antiporter subunit A
MASPLAILAVALLALVTPGVARLFPRAGGLLLGSAVAAIGALLVVASPGSAGAPFSVPWLPSAGLTLSFRLDALALLFAALVTGMGALVVVYGWSYLADDPARRARGMAILLAFAASMLGLVLADDLILLYVFWELTSVTSWLLIQYHHERVEARLASWQALLVTAAGGLALLAGAVLLSLAAGTSRISELVATAPALARHPWLPWIAGLVLAGILTKSAQVPFQGWLPRAMEAPTPVSAYLHAATMVKAGIYLALRLLPVLAAAAPFRVGLLVAGAASLLLGAIRAALASDLKSVLACSTVSGLGLILLLVGVGTPAAVHAAIAYLVAHGLYKGALFLVAGAVDHATGTRDTDRLSGLRRAQPLVAAAAALAGLSMAGAPATFGFVAKEAAYGGLLDPARPLVLAVLVAGSALLGVSAAVVAWLPFRARRGVRATDAHAVSPALWGPPLALAVLGIALGIVPALPDRAVGPAAAGVRPGPVETLALFHGWTGAALSAGTLAFALALLAARPRVRAALGALGAARADPFRRALRALETVAKVHTRVVQTGSLRRALAVTFAVAAILLAAGFVRAGGVTGWRAGAPRAPELLLGLLAMAAALAAVRSRSRIGAIVALGAVGYSIGLLFLLFGAPDLAMTQIAIETVTVMVLLLAFRHLPHFIRVSSWTARARDATIAVAVGGLMTLLVLAATRTRPPDPISDAHLALSVPEAHGHNVVNTILVDFRGLDTMGEVTVLAIAGFGIVALLKLRPRQDA